MRKVGCQDSSPTLTNCTISENRTQCPVGSDGCWGIGGGLFCEGNSSPTLTNCTISGNSAVQGGGVYCDSNSSPTLTNCTISGNSAGQGGGGVYCNSGSSPTLTNCTISGNLAWAGGGVYCGSGSSPTLTNCTIAENSGGGLYLGQGSSPILTNCILFAPWAGPLLSWEQGASAPRMTTCNIYWDGTDDELESVGDFLAELDTNWDFEDPLFVKKGIFDFGLAHVIMDPPDFIIDPPDYHLQSGSPCIDVGTSEGAPATDIEGHGRPCGTGVDIGAYEYGDCPPPIPFKRGDASADDKIDLTDAIYVLSWLYLGGKEPSCQDAADANDDGKIDLTDGIYILSYLYLGGKAPPAPGPKVCGPDTTPSAVIMKPCVYSACP